MFGRSEGNMQIYKIPLINATTLLSYKLLTMGFK